MELEEWGRKDPARMQRAAEPFYFGLVEGEKFGIQIV